MLLSLWWGVHPTNAQCSPNCDGSGSSESCLWCPNGCGVCSLVGVVDHCSTPGVAHISFDDGPGDTTGTILDVLDTKGVKASFWLVGANVPQYPAYVQRIVRDGHAIGTHSQTHSHLNAMTLSQVDAEMTQSIAAIRAAAPACPTIQHMRPPYGEINTPVRKQLQNTHKLTPVLWNLDTQDWQGNIPAVYSNVTSHLKGYSVRAHAPLILMHASKPETAQTISGVIDIVRSAGYRFVDLAECLQQWTPPQSPSPDECFHSPSSPAFGTCSRTIECPDSVGGTCCSAHGQCGVGPDYCGAGCQNGACDTCVARGDVPFRRSSSSSSSTGAKSSTGTLLRSSTGASSSTGTSRSSTGAKSSTGTLLRSSTGASSSTGTSRSSTGAKSSTGVASSSTALPSSTGGRSSICSFRRCGPGIGRCCGNLCCNRDGTCGSGKQCKKGCVQGPCDDDDDDDDHDDKDDDDDGRRGGHRGGHH
jgi:peptidoglycan/xylan/chitin deacetylase (PgdA/CDA1 family)